jgi:hypothetical protein
MIDVELILIELKKDKNPRTQKSLDILHNILKEYKSAGHQDYSITTISKVSSLKGGPGYASIRATKNYHYRRLIESWATNAGTTLKKPLSKSYNGNTIPKDFELLGRITDVAVRALFGQIIAERNRFKKEVNLLKQNSNIIIDRRPVTNSHDYEYESEKKSWISEAHNSLTASEIKALNYAISDECMDCHNWDYTQAGQVKDMKYNTEVFPRGFITAIRKILG